jgi:hemerythrin
MAPRRTKNAGFRITDDERARLNNVVKRVRERNEHMDESKVLREIIGLTKRHFVTDEDLLILQGISEDEAIKAAASAGSENARREAIQGVKRFIRVKGGAGRRLG